MRDVCLLLGSGATHASGLECERNGIGYKLSSVEPPTDEAFFGSVEIDEAYFPALKLLISSKPGPKSLESAFSLIDCAYKFRSQEWRERDFKGEEKTLLGESLKKWGFNELGDFLSFINEMEYEYYKKFFNCSPKKIASFNAEKLENSPHYFTGHCGTELLTLIFRIYSSIRQASGPNVIATSVIRELLSYKPFNILTFNYDLLAEVSMESLFQQFSYVGYNGLSNLHYSPGMYSSPPAAIVKLHGSLNWIQQGFKLPVLFQRDPVEPYFHEKVVFRQPAIIPPVMAKNIFDDDGGDQLRIITRQQWSYAETILRKASHLVIIGYSFPKTDDYVREFLSRISKIRLMSSDPIKIFYCRKFDEGLSDDVLPFVKGLGNLTDLENGGLANVNAGRIRQFLQK